MSGMEDVESITVHPFGDGLLVELLGTDERGEIATATIEFEIATALSAKGYSLVDG